VIAITASGYTARLVSHCRPQAAIIAITPEEYVQRQLKLYWGIIPLLAPRCQNTDEMISSALQTAKKHKLVGKDDLVAITAGTAGSEPGTTNLMQISIIN
jgi:pyruvate kinase